MSICSSIVINVPLSSGVSIEEEVVHVWGTHRNYFLGSFADKLKCLKNKAY